MPQRGDLKKILILGSGPIVIGQACEFDYSGSQACKVLKEEGYKVILINSNPATIMTDPEFADAIVFLTIALSDEERFSEALSQLKELKEIEVAPQLQSVLDSQGLIGKVYAEAKNDLLQESNQPRLGLLEMDIDIALKSANYLLQSDKPQRSVSVLKLFQAVLDEEPSNPEALSREALLLAQTGDGAPVVHSFGTGPRQSFAAICLLYTSDAADE